MTVINNWIKLTRIAEDINGGLERWDMPNPKDYIDDDHVYVRGHVRNKPYAAFSEETEKSKKTALWWFDRLSIAALAIALIVTFFLDKMIFYILLGFAGMIFFLVASTRNSRHHRKNKTTARRIWRRLI